MKYQQLIIALPCHSLEDFPLYHQGEAAEGLLANWTALWHPALIAAAEAIVTWCRCDTPPEDLANRLLVIPSVGAADLPTGFAQRAQEQGACVVRKQHVRDEIVAAALAELDGGGGGAPADLVNDFYALGYCYLQVQLLTRQMRYASNLDEVHFKNVAVDAAQAALRGDEAHARERLAAGFNLLAEERDRYYPVEAFILDLTLVGSTTIGASLRDEIAAAMSSSRDIATNDAATGSAAHSSTTSAPRANFLLSGEVLAELAAKEPDSLAMLRAATESGQVALIGGHFHEGMSALLSRESLLADLLHGLDTYQHWLGTRPHVYGRWRHGLSPALPGILNGLGFTGALHVPFEEGRVPEGTQFKVRWEGSDGAAIDAIARPPLDASLGETFLGLAVKMGESMDRDHVATVCLAHWPGQSSVWYEDLRRIASYCPALGKFISIDEYFAHTDISGQVDEYRFDQYRAPYLKQQVIRRADNPITSVVQYWRRRAARQAMAALDTLAALVSGDPSSAEKDENQGDNILLDNAADAALASQLEKSLERSIARFAAALPTAQTPAEVGYLVFNPCSFVRRMGVTLPKLTGTPAIERPVYAAAADKDVQHVVVDVPPLGFAWVASGAGAASGKKEVPLAEDLTLRNEYFEALINATTGSLQSIHEYNARANRLSQQLALRLSSGDEEVDDGSEYSVMAADKVEVTASSTAHGEITSTGRLLDRKGKTLAKFVQRFQVWRGSRVLKIEIELDPVAELKSDPWNSYYCLRWAWGDEAAEVVRMVNEVPVPTDAKRFEAPQYTEIADAKTRTTILTGGLPYHRRHEYRKLDTILLVRGDTGRKFTLGIGVELAEPLHEALSLVMPPTLLARTSPPPLPATSSWLFHLDSKHFVATHWAPLVLEGRVAGFRIRVAEIGGRAGQVKLSAFRPVTRARICNLRGESPTDATVDEGRVVLDLAASEWLEVEAEW
jgi:alpha-mannosidase